MAMKMFVVLKTQVYVDPDTQQEVYFDNTKLDHPLVTFKSATVGRYDWVAYLADVTLDQALAVIDTLINDPTV